MAPARAQRPPNVTDGELALLPLYCPDTQGFKYGDAYTNTSPRAKQWIAQMGPAFWALHHHCWALIKVRRAMVPGIAKPIRTGMLKNAIGDFHYVVQHSAADFVLLPEIFLKMGDTYMLLGEVANAAEAYTQARTRKPDFWPPYSQWADALDKSGNRKAALLHLEEGMRQAPSATALAAHYKRLGGDPAQFLRTLPPPKPSAPASAPASVPAPAAVAASAPVAAPAASSSP